MRIVALLLLVSSSVLAQQEVSITAPKPSEPAPRPDAKVGDELLAVTVYTVKWGYRVGEFSGHKGDKISLTGIYHELKGRTAGSGVIGGLAVNDRSLRELTR